MRRRSVLLLVAGVAGVAVWRRASVCDYVEVAYDDGSFVRLVRGPEATDLLRDARAILGGVAP